MQVREGSLGGVRHFDRKQFGDHRGMFVEMYRKTVYTEHGIQGVPQISLSRSVANVMRGIHTSPYSKLVTCLKGRMWDCLVDLRVGSPTYKQIEFFELAADQMTGVLIPPGVGHAFVALEDVETLYIQADEFSSFERDVSPFDPEFAIPWPIPRSQMIVSAKDEAAPLLSADEVQARLKHNWNHVPRKCDVLLMGETGYFGMHYEKHLRAKGVDFVVVPCRLHQREEICRWLDQCSPDALICAAGTAGRPNINWCETHSDETIDMNVTSQLSLAEDCRTRGIHCTLMLTGMMYDPSLNEPGHVFTEQDPPNIHQASKPCPMYCQLRIVEEHLLTMGKYTEPETNPGQMTHNELMLLYKKYVEPEATWELATEEEMCNARVNAPLSMEKLFAVYPEARELVPDVAQSVEAMMKRAGEQSNKRAKK